MRQVGTYQRIRHCWAVWTALLGARLLLQKTGLLKKQGKTIGYQAGLVVVKLVKQLVALLQHGPTVASLALEVKLQTTALTFGDDGDDDAFANSEYRQGAALVLQVLSIYINYICLKRMIISK